MFYYLIHSVKDKNCI